MNAQFTPSNLTQTTIDAMLDSIQQIFRQVRPLIVNNAGISTSTQKIDGTPVTDIDQEVENILLDTLAKEFSGLPVFGEESGYESQLPETCWLLDPIDGTASFIKNIPTFTCMAVLIVAKQTVASIIYNPSTDEMYVAQKNKGAYKNGVRLELQKKPLARIAVSKGRYIKTLDNILSPHDVHCEIAPSGAGHGFAMVAEGLSAARFQLHSKGQIHDYATGALLVQEAGGKLIPIEDTPYTYATKSFIACHPELESTLLKNIDSIKKL